MLYGDGIRDDTRGIQALLDRGGEVFLPGGRYLISDTLKIRSGTALRLAADAVIRLADGAHCVMLENEGLHERRRNGSIRVSGGIWDGNNAHQTRDEFPAFDDRLYWGIALRFVGVDDLTISDCTVKDPESFSMQLADVCRFTVEHITFDHNLLKPNMDGVHVQGPARFGLIRDIKGVTNDDMVALNCNDGRVVEITRGDIEDVTVDGVYADCGYTGIRLLSCGDVLRNVHIANVYGTYRFYAVSLTHHKIHPGEPVLLENITIDHVSASKPDWLPPEESTFSYPLGHAFYADREPLIWFANGITARSVRITDVTRMEKSVTHAPTVLVGEDAVVEGLILRDIRQRFLRCEPAPVFENHGTVLDLTMENVCGPVR